MAMMLIVLILVFAGAGLFALGYLVGRRTRPTQRGFDVVAVHDEKQH